MGWTAVKQRALSFKKKGLWGENLHLVWREKSRPPTRKNGATEEWIKMRLKGERKST